MFLKVHKAKDERCQQRTQSHDEELLACRQHWFHLTINACSYGPGQIAPGHINGKLRRCDFLPADIHVQGNKADEYNLANKAVAYYHRQLKPLLIPQIC